MKKSIYLFVCLYSLLVACIQREENDSLTTHDIVVFDAKGHVVPTDSLTPPQIIPLDKSNVIRIPARKPIVTSPYKNRIQAGPPKIRDAGQPKVITPGKNGYPLPKVVPVVDSPFLAPLSVSIPVSDAKSKDDNPHGFLIYDKAQGLHHDIISDLIQDRNGNLWFGYSHYGVTKFDGKFFTHYSTENGLSSNLILCIFEDSHGNLWIGTNGYGVTKYDGMYFTHYSMEEGLINGSVYNIIEDRFGNIWIGSWGCGVTKYDGKTFTQFGEQQGMSTAGMTILEDVRGNLWFGTGVHGLIKYDGSDFFQYGDEQGLSGTGEHGLVGNHVVQLIEDRNYNIWIGTAKTGITKFDGHTFYQFSTEEGLCNNHVITTLEDNEGTIWIGTIGGISMYDGTSFTQFNIESGLPANQIFKIMQDQTGNIWIGSNGGLIKYTGHLFRHFTRKEGLPSANIYSILRDQSGEMWFAGRGITSYNNTDFKQIPLFDDLPILYTNNLTQDGNGHLWFILNADHLVKYDKEFLTRYARDARSPSGPIHALAVDSRNNLWMGTDGSGLVYFDGEMYKHYFKGNSGLSDPDILDIIADRSNRIWLATYGGGITVLEDERFTHFKQSTGFVNDYVSCLFEDRLGNIWIGTFNDGLCKCTLDPLENTLRCIHFTEKNGIINNIITNIYEDRDSNIIIGTEKGLSILSRENGRKLEEHLSANGTTGFAALFTNFTIQDGFLGFGVHMGNSICEDNDGALWIGAHDRLTLYDPLGDNISSDTITPNIQLYALDLFNEQIDWVKFMENKKHTQTLENGVGIRQVDFDGLSRWYGIPEKLSLNHKNNYLTFRYVGITLHRPKSVKYQYMLEGNDEQWSPLTTSTEAHYGNLTHGTYVFKVKAMNDAGRWSKELQYSFTIRPPWWLTWWAFTAYGLLAIMTIVTVYRYQVQRIIRKERERTQKQELEQAKEIEKAYAELKSTQSQLIQREKMASLGEMTAGIAHEIQNPLNFVNNFSEVNTELIAEMKQELEQGREDDAKAIADTIYENEQKITFHGKRADAIVKSMLQHSRGSTGQKELTNLNELADEYLRLSFHGLRAKDKSFNADFQIQKDESLPMVKAIPQDIGRVLLNLINNAFYSTQEKKKTISGEYMPKVTVTTQNLRDKIEIRVIDNGTGIPDAIKDKVFQPFFTTKPTGLGTGLGLSISYEIIRAHGGDMHVMSEEGSGSEFIIQLPYNG